MRRLILDAHTPATRALNPRTNTEQLYITNADVEAFHARYFTPRTMANAYQWSWQSLGMELKQHDVLPFSFEGRNYGRIFLRRSIESFLRAPHSYSEQGKDSEVPWGVLKFLVASGPPRTLATVSNAASQLHQTGHSLQRQNLRETNSRSAG